MNGGRDVSRLLAVTLVTVGVLGCAASIASRTSQPLADQRNLIPAVRIQQDDINTGAVQFTRLFYAGKHIFSSRFTTEDHYGEGPMGPRRSMYGIEDREGYPFLRFNGMDSQSCLECHLAIGFAPQKNQVPTSGIRTGKQLGFTAGGAGFASSAFGLANFGCLPATTCDAQHGTRGVVRNPPHAFGAGYTQTLAEEMSWDLQELVANASPGDVVQLVTKGVSFGQIVLDQAGTPDFSHANTHLEGISQDLIVRPFQWRGVAQNLRNFVRGAMDFHFSVQPKELLDDPAHPIPDDLDAERDEILEGEISAVATFLAFLRPPIESSVGLDPVAVQRGRAVFHEVACDSCHRPHLRIDDPVATIRDPRMDQQMMSMIEAQAPRAMAAQRLATAEEPRGVEFITVPSSVSPTLLKYAVMKHRGVVHSIQAEGVRALAVHEVMKGFSRGLSRKDGPPETRPRLPATGGGVDVPLYSDLKRHRMGDNLAEPFPQTDDGRHDVDGRDFLTRPLWGVADTAPWLHDGRALTLTDAILMHSGNGSEANASVAQFSALPSNDQLALRTFLSSLRLPTVPR